MSETEHLMFDFAARTRLASSDVAPKRYLWTDATTLSLSVKAANPTAGARWPTASECSV